MTSLTLKKNAQSKNIYGSYLEDRLTERQTEVINTFQLSLEIVKNENSTK